MSLPLWQELLLGLLSQLGGLSSRGLRTELLRTTAVCSGVVGGQHGHRWRPWAVPQGLGKGAYGQGDRGLLVYCDHDGPDRERLERPLRERLWGQPEDDTDTYIRAGF